MKIKFFISLVLFLASLNTVLAIEENEFIKEQNTSKFQSDHSIIFKELYKNILVIMKPSLEKNTSLRS